MALAYAPTDLATGHSRDFALRPACWECGLRMRRGSTRTRRRQLHHQALLRYIGCNADTHLLAAHWGDEITWPSPSHRYGNRAEFVELMVRALKRKLPARRQKTLEEAVKRGLAEGPQVNIPTCPDTARLRSGSPSALPEDIRGTG